MKTAREKLDIITGYEETGSYRVAAELCGTTHKTVKRVVAKCGVDPLHGGRPIGRRRPRRGEPEEEAAAHPKAKRLSCAHARPDFPVFQQANQRLDGALVANLTQCLGRCPPHL